MSNLQSDWSEIEGDYFLNNAQHVIKLAYSYHGTPRRPLVFSIGATNLLIIEKVEGEEIKNHHHAKNGASKTLALCTNIDQAEVCHNRLCKNVVYRLWFCPG